MRFMKRNLKILVVVLLMAATSCSFTTKKFDDPNKDKLLIDLITYVLNEGHYDARDINDEFSEGVYDKYLEGLDGSKRFFYKSDIEEFNAYRDKIDDQIKEKQIDFFDLTYNRLLKRSEEARDIYREILEKPFDFSKTEDINTDFSDAEYVSSKKELKERWRKQLKFSTLITYFDKIEEEEQKKEEDSDYEMKSKEELEKEAREVTLSSLEEYYDFTDDLERKVISGGPAWRSEELSEGDEILKVQQEDEEDPVSIVGMRLEDAVDLIKGPKDSKVTLTVRKKLMGNIEEITLTRDIVEIEETYAKTAMVQEEGKNFGIINLPKFYFNMEDYEERNAASDIKKDIIRLKEQNMDGLVLDLRNNGGGSLKTVVDIAGLFIEEGPIVQVKSNGQRKDVLSDEDPSVLWDGPLVILVNELSASASEILAAAMQDYKRAIIIGSKQTYGKGTVQNVIDLNRWLRSNEFGDVGALKLTTQKFYRVNGGSTQLEGVKSDVVVPDRYSFVDIGEKDQDNPLPWDKIDPANYRVWDGYVNFEKTITESKERMDTNQQLKLIEQHAKWIKDQSEDSFHSLNFEEYASTAERNQEMAKRFDSIKNYKTNLTFTSLPYEEELFQNDTILKEKRDRWHSSLSKDVYVEEAIHMLADMKKNNIRQDKLAKVQD